MKTILLTLILAGTAIVVHACKQGLKIALSLDTWHVPAFTKLFNKR